MTDTRGEALLSALERAGLWAVQLMAREGALAFAVVDGAGPFAQHLVMVAGRQSAALPPRWRRLWRDWRQPLGVSVALLGPDGTGKSTVAKGCCERLGALFSNARVQHLRPTLVPELQRLVAAHKWGKPRPKVDATDPHGKPPAGTLSSLIRLSYYSGDYLFGYLPLVRAAAARGELLLFDRYHVDFLADPLRWRLGLPELPRRLATALLPLPDLVVLLDGPAPLLHARKAELPVAEIARQSEVYRSRVRGLQNGHVVSVEQSPQAVVSQVCSLILRRQARVVRQRLKSVTIGEADG